MRDTFATYGGGAFSPDALHLCPSPSDSERAPVPRPRWQYTGGSRQFFTSTSSDGAPSTSAAAAAAVDSSPSLSLLGSSVAPQTGDIIRPSALIGSSAAEKESRSDAPGRGAEEESRGGLDRPSHAAAGSGGRTTTEAAPASLVLPPPDGGDAYEDGHTLSSSSSSSSSPPPPAAGEGRWPSGLWASAAAAGWWLPDNPLGAPTEREVFMEQVTGGRVYRLYLEKRRP